MLFDFSRISFEIKRGFLLFFFFLRARREWKIKIENRIVFIVFIINKLFSRRAIQHVNRFSLNPDWFTGRVRWANAAFTLMNTIKIKYITDVTILSRNETFLKFHNRKYNYKRIIELIINPNIWKILSSYKIANIYAKSNLYAIKKIVEIKFLLYSSNIIFS